MHARRAALVATLLGLAAASCGSAAPSAHDDETDGLATTRIAVRRPFLGGAFVTWAQEMPVEVDQAIEGRPTDRPVVVWAGTDLDLLGRRVEVGQPSDRPDPLSR